MTSPDRKRRLKSEDAEDRLDRVASASFEPPPAKSARLLPPEPTTSAAAARDETVVDLVHDGDGVEAPSDDEIEFVGVTGKKSVRFSEIEHEVFYFKRDPAEQHAFPSLGAIDEDEPASAGSSGVRPSSDHSRATDLYTVISSHHGRARRELRRISKRDLRAAVKHGRKLPARPNPRTGEPRWKFAHDGLVYITDSTGTREVTSYREEIGIDPIAVSNEMMDRHVEVKTLLKEQPHLCTGHTFVVIDQSGSMRNSDVDGFKSRSHAAYRCLSLEFVSEQLSQTNPDNLFAESVTVIEMRDEGKAVFERVPFDWILFNRMLKRPEAVRPSHQGNYCESLVAVRDMILKEVNTLLSDDIEHDELPIFSLVWLSDGRPSDGSRASVLKRTDILKHLCGTLKQKFIFYAMGIGAREAEFDVLQSMVNTVTEHGSVGSFVHAGTSAVKLSQTFSQLSSTLTSHRTTLLGEENSNSTSKVKKDFTMRKTGKTVGLKMPSIKFTKRSHSFSRCRYDKTLFAGGTAPWKECDPLATHGADGVEVETQPFGKGSERLAYRFNELKGGIQVGKTMVAKNSLHVRASETRDSFHKEFARVQDTAYDLAEHFNTAVRTAPELQPATTETKAPPLKFSLCHVYTIKSNETKEETCYLVEKMLQGKFMKYNTNNGYVKDTKARTMELKNGREVPLEQFVQAFSHWIYERTEHEMLVCDLQGVLNEEGRYPEFHLTDPAICTRRGQRFGKTDLRLKGIRSFCKTHRCGLVCKGLNLPRL